MVPLDAQPTKLVINAQEYKSSIEFIAYNSAMLMDKMRVKVSVYCDTMSTEMLWLVSGQRVLPQIE
jgi:hypothetical protein